ncbi:MAG: NADH-quinone oxidoreductase subunit NuoE [Thermodesulfovibrionales bacterium]|nr:NADH-quinone oxidoreductase subunit NuoE [Thermodesulfovibrionales bacterium]
MQEILKKYSHRKGALIPILQDIQELLGFVPKEIAFEVSKQINVHPVDIYSILTFYSQFYTEPRGKNIIKVCMGTACHVMGASEIFDYISKKLNITDGQTTKDNKFTLEKVMCLGCCGMAPVITVNENFYGRCQLEKANKILKELQTGDMK